MRDKIPDLQNLQYFIAVGKSTSITAASAEYGIPVATLSRKITELEKRINVQLFTRNSRGIVLTDTGKYYLKHVDLLIQNAIALESEIQAIYNSPSGLLRISLPVDFCITFISPLLKRFTSTYPNIKFIFDISPEEFIFSDKQIDIRIQLGSVSDLSLIARPVGFLSRKLYASPSYLAQCKEISHPYDLIHHQCILPLYMKNPEQWVLHRENESAKVNVCGNYSVSNIDMMLNLAENDCGIAVLTPVTIQRELKSSSLLPVLSGWAFNPVPVYVITKTRHISQSTRVFVEYITRQLSLILNRN